MLSSVVKSVNTVFRYCHISADEAEVHSLAEPLRGIRNMRADPLGECSLQASFEDTRLGPPYRDSFVSIDEWVITWSISLAATLTDSVGAILLSCMILIDEARG